MEIINNFENKTGYYYCVYEDIEKILGKDNIIIFDDRKYIQDYDDLNHEQKYIYLHISKKGDIKIKDVIEKMTYCYFYLDDTFQNDFIFLENFNKKTDIQYNLEFGKWTNF